MANEKVIFKRGPSSALPTTKVAGTILIDTTTGNTYLDDSSTSRIQLKDSTKLPVNGNAASATKLQTARNIDGVSFNGTSSIVHYGTCSTAAATAAKEVACTGFVILSGAKITVRFANTNTAANPTLNVNNTGAKPIYYRNAAIPASYLAANRIYTFVYDGGQYELVGDINTDTNTTYTALKNPYAITIQGNGTSLGTYDGSAAKTINITAASVGAAASSHTHKYAGSASAGGAANSVANALTISLNGTSQGAYNGSAAKSINITPSAIGAAAASHGRHVPDACTKITDWNDATTTGWYMASGATNAPTSGSAWYFGYVIAHTTDYVYQEAYQFTVSTDAKAIPKYIRAKTNGTWGAWTNVTVAKAVPEDAKFTDTNTWRGVQNNLTSTATDQSLSAAQGKALKALIDGKAASSHTHSYLPLSGGTVSSANFGPLIIKRTTNAFASLRFENSEGILGSIGMNAVNGDLYKHTPDTTESCVILDRDNTYHYVNSATDAWSTVGASNSSGYLFKVLRGAPSSQVKPPSWFAPDCSAGIIFGSADTKGILSMAYNKPQITLAGGNQSSTKTKPTWYISLTGTSAKTYNLDNFSTTSHTHSYLPLAGGTMTGQIKFNTGTRTSIPVKVIDGDANGSMLVVGGGTGGLTIVGGGESATSLENLVVSEAGLPHPVADNTKIAKNTESLILSADSDIWIMTNCNTVANRKAMVFTAGGHFYPCTTNVSSLGTSTYKWANAYATTFHGALDGNASTASKWQTARKITLGTGLEGSVNIDGSANVTLNGSLKRCIQVDDTSDFASYAWHKFAETTVTTGSYDSIITFLVGRSFGSVSHVSGILTARLRTSSAKIFEGGELSWLLAGYGIDPDDFVMVYTNTANTSTKVELWHKHTARWEGWSYTVLKEHHRTNYGSLWTLFDQNGHGSASHTTGTGKIVSTITTLKNPAPATSHTHSYLPLSGGTMSGYITFPDTGNHIHVKQRDASHFATAIDWLKGGTSQAAYNPSVSQHNTGGDGSGSMILLPYATDTSPWGGDVGLFIAKNTLKLDGKNVSMEGHTHSYLPLSGGSMTGTISSSKVTQSYLAGNQGQSIINSTAAAGSYVMLAKMNSTNGYFTHGTYQNEYLLQYTSKTIVDAGTNNVKKQAVLLDEGGNSSFPGTVNGAAFKGTATDFVTGKYGGYEVYFRNDGANFNILLSDKDGTTFNSFRPFKINLTTGVASINGNAATATKLATARTIRTKLGSTSTASFNGTANVTPGVEGTLPIGNGGTGATAAHTAANNLKVPSLNGGNAIADNTDLNSLTTPGTYSITQASSAKTMKNTPITDCGFTIYVMNPYPANVTNKCTYQLALKGGANVWYLRYCNSSGTWSAWSQMKFTDNNTDTKVTATALTVQPSSNMDIVRPLLFAASNANSDNSIISSGSAIPDASKCTTYTGGVNMCGGLYVKTNYWTTGGSGSYCELHVPNGIVVARYFNGIAESADHLSHKVNINDVPFDGNNAITLTECLYSATGSASVTLDKAVTDFDLLIIKAKTTMSGSTTQFFIRPATTGATRHAVFGSPAAAVHLMGSIVFSVNNDLKTMNGSMHKNVLNVNSTTATATSGTAPTVTITEVYGFKFKNRKE